MNWLQMSDGELVAAFASAGADEAFAELVRRHAIMVFRTCRRITGSHADAEDATQAVFATVIVKAHELSACASLGGWLYSVAWHVSRRYRRSELSRRRRELRTTPVMPVEGEEADPDLVAELYRAMEMLPAEYRDAIVLHHLEGCTIQQVADVMGSSIGTTAARLSRARAMMRERLSWRGVVMTDAMIATFIVSDLLLEPVPKSVATRAAMAGAANASTTSAAIVAVSVAARSGAGTGASAAPAIGSGVAVYAGLRTTQWVAATCTSLLIGGATAGFTALVHNAKTQVRVTESASVSRSNTSAGSDMAERPQVRSRDDSQQHVPEPSSLGLLMFGGLFFMRRRRSV